jgi:hypothetical protein
LIYPQPLDGTSAVAIHIVQIAKFGMSLVVKPMKSFFGSTKFVNVPTAHVLLLVAFMLTLDSGFGITVLSLLIIQSGQLGFEFFVFRARVVLGREFRVSDYLCLSCTYQLSVEVD